STRDWSSDVCSSDLPVLRRETTRPRVLTLRSRRRYAACMATRKIHDPEHSGPGALRTPLVRVDGVWVKLEHLNPSGSVKDRVAKIGRASCRERGESA